jgi:hypothetical protein
LSYLWETIAVKNEGVEKLAEGHWLQHPASKPPRSLPSTTIFDTPYQSFRFAGIPSKLEGAE